MTAETTGQRSVAGVEVAEPKAGILIVDDHLESVESMAATLEVLGEEILMANSAEQALRHLLKHDVAVIVLDVLMPGMDGFQLASLIRERDRFRHTPIIFLTGLGGEDNQMLQGYRSGAVDYLTKPCDAEVLRSKVKIFVDLAKKTELLRRYTALVERKNTELLGNAGRLREALDRTLSINADLEREIAERKRVELTRDRLAGQLGAAPDFVEAMAEGAVTLALDQSILYCNRRFAALLGREIDELLGTPLGSYLPPESVSVFGALFDQAFQSSAKAELEILDREGERVPVQLALNLFQGSELQAVAMVVTDLRDHLRNQEVVAQGRLARQILEHSLSGIAVCDPSGRITLASAALAQMCGGNPLFKSFDELFTLAAEDGPVSVNDVLTGRVHTSTPVTFLRRDGRNLHLLLSAGPITRAGEAPAGCVITLVDISEWKHVEEALRRSEKLAAAGRIAGTLAHEVNNPLSSITNLLFLLETNSSLDESARQYLAMASAETARVSHIVRSTLAFYRESTVAVPLNVPEIVDNVLELFASNISTKEVTVDKRYRLTQHVLGYPGETRQVISNLVSNAIDAVSQGGRISVRSRRARDWKSGNSGIRISVADSGSGIAREHYERLFEPFFTTKGEKGTGLGLWVTHDIVQKRGGFIRVRSGKYHGRSGTVFSIFLPVASAGALPSRHPPELADRVAAGLEEAI